MKDAPSNVLRFRPRKRPNTLRVRLSDNSMIGAGLAAGTVLDFAPAADYAAGACVAVKTPDGLFVKFIYPAPDDYVLLYGAHEGCKPRLYRRSEVKVRGLLARPTAAHGATRAPR